MRNTFWNRRIPTFIALLFIVVGTGVSAWLVQNGYIFNTEAAPGNEPENIKFTNISNTSFSVTFTTDDSVPSSIAYGETKDFGNIAGDDRDSSAQATPRRTHHITVKNLTSERQYFFSIVAGGETFLQEGSPYTISLPKPLEETSADSIPIAGTVQTAAGASPQEGYITFFVEGSQTLSTTLSQDGTFSLPISAVRNEQLDQFLQIDNTTSANIFATDAIGSAEVTFLLDGSPLPVITLGNSYDFSLNPSDLPTDASISAELEFPEVEKETSNEKNPEITTPTHGETFSDDQPEFEGTALPSEAVTIVIHSDENVTAKVFADKSGKWSFRPEKPLSPGTHTITITTRDDTGFLRTLTQSFTVFAEGSQFVEPSVSPRASVTPTKTPTPKTSSAPTPTTQEKETTPTAEPTIEPTEKPITVVPSLSQSVTPVPTIPQVGNSSLILSGIGGVIFVIIGLTIFLLARSSIPL